MSAHYGTWLSTARSRRMRRIAVGARWLAAAGTALMAVRDVYLVFDTEALLLALALPDRSLLTADQGAIIMAWALGSIPTCISIAGLWFARRLFARYAQGETFDPRVPELLGALGLLAIVGAAAGIVVRSLASLVLSLGTPAGEPHLTIGIASHEIAALIIGLLLAAFALVTHDALRLEEGSTVVL